MGYKQIQRSKAHNNDLVVRFVYDSQGYMIPVKDLLDPKNPKRARNSDDPAIFELVEFLKTKYLNVNKKTLLIGKNWKEPIGWKMVKRGNDIVPEIIYKTHEKGYSDFLLENYLYTHVQKSEKSTGIPDFVNHYATFEFKDAKDSPNKVDHTVESEPAPAQTGDAPAQTLTGLLAGTPTATDTSVTPNGGDAPAQTLTALLGQTIDTSDIIPPEGDQTEVYCADGKDGTSTNNGEVPGVKV